MDLEERGLMIRRGPGPSYINDDHGGGGGGKLPGNLKPKSGPVREKLILSWGLSMV
jgi:hypothetical protein